MQNQCKNFYKSTRKLLSKEIMGIKNSDHSSDPEESGK